MRSKCGPTEGKQRTSPMTFEPMPKSVFVSIPRYSLVLGILLTGCASTKEITVDYPIPPAAVQEINGAGGRSVIELSDSETVLGERLTVDSMTARWLEGEWRAAPIAGIRSLTVPDRAEEGSHFLAGVLYSAAGFAAIGLAEGLSNNRQGVVGEALRAGGAGALAAVVTSNVWGPATEPRVRYTIRPPQSAREATQREMDRNRIENETRISISELNARSRNFRLAPSVAFGLGNPVNPESDASSPLAIGCGLSFGMQIWERAELGLELNVASHAFRRTHPDESVVRLNLLLTGTYFPVRNSGLFVRGGIGFGSYSATGTYTGSVRTTPSVTPSAVIADGLALSVGAGYDIRLADAWSLRPSVQYTLTPLGALKLNDQVVIATGRSSAIVTGVVTIVYRGVI